MPTSRRSNGQTQRVANTKLCLLVRTVATGNDPRTSYSSSITRATPFFPSFPRKGQSRLVNTRTVPSPTASDQRGWGIGAGGYGTENTPPVWQKTMEALSADCSRMYVCPPYLVLSPGVNILTPPAPASRRQGREVRGWREGEVTATPRHHHQQPPLPSQHHHHCRGNGGDVCDVTHTVLRVPVFILDD